jgi:hypothetical protein
LFTVNCLHLPWLSSQANFMAVARVLLGLLLLWLDVALLLRLLLLLHWGRVGLALGNPAWLLLLLLLRWW